MKISIHKKGLSLILEGKNYDVILGHFFKNRKVARYIFDGWIDKFQREKYHGSILFLEEEALGGRVPFTQKINLIFYRIVLRTGNQILEWKNTERGASDAAQGAVIEVEYNTLFSSPEKIEDFFKRMGIAVHRAAPFEKPIKTIWQVVRDLVA